MTVTFKDTPVTLHGSFPQVGQAVPALTLTKGDLSEVSLSDFSGKKVVINIFPSVDTPVCALQVKTFSQRLAARDDTVLLFASLDLPFALGRFCVAEGIENAVTASDFRHHSLAENYGVKITSGPLVGLYARGVVVIDESHKVIHSELVSEITQEPNYDTALAAL